jgi:hypothetical protein
MRFVSSCAGIALVLATVIFWQESRALSKPSFRGQSKSVVAEPGLSDLLESKIRTAWTAFKNKNKQAYSEFLADDFIAVYADGEGTRDKAHVLRDVDSSVVSEVLLSRFNVAPLGSDAAFVTYEAFLQFPPKAGVRFEKVYISEVWVKRDGQWKSLHYQETRVK